MNKKLMFKILELFYPLAKSFMPFQVYAYLAVGATNTILNIALFSCLFKAFIFSKFALETATLISFAITIATGFWLNKNIAFSNASNNKKENTKQFGKYFLVSIQGQLGNYFITKGLIIFMFINPLMAYFISTIIMLTVTYFLQKHFTFKKHEAII